MARPNVLPTFDDEPCLRGGKAVVVARRILSTPGTVAIDFETSIAPAHQRVPHILSIQHSRGDDALIRLTKPHVELREMFAPIIEQGTVADATTLVAHNAQFETEVLLKHDVAADIECTMLAARSLELVAVPKGVSQPVEFSLQALAARRLGVTLDKSIRDRDWSQPLDQTAAGYAMDDAKACLALWLKLRAELVEQKLLPGYRVIQVAVLPTAAVNLQGMRLDVDAHARLCTKLKEQVNAGGAELTRACNGAIMNHGSTMQVSNWIVEEVLGLQALTEPVPPKHERLAAFVKRIGGLRLDPGGEVAARELPNRLLSLTGRQLDDVCVLAAEEGFGELDHDELLELLVADCRRDNSSPVLKEQDQAEADAYAEAVEVHELTLAALNERGLTQRARLLTAFDMRLRNATGQGWRWTGKARNLQINKAAMSRKPAVLRPHWPNVADYLEARAAWTKAKTLLNGFGPNLRQHVAEDGRVRGSFRVFATVTGRHSCTNPNLQNQPTDPEFRAIWVAPTGSKLAICDYGQIELRLLAIVSGDERLLAVYRNGLDVHAETLAVTGVPTRRLAKNINFSIAYGGGAAGLSENYGIPIDEAEMFLAKFLEAYPGVDHYRRTALKTGLHHGQIDIRPHRRVVLNHEYDVEATKAVNYPVQGGAASVQMRAMRLVYDGLADIPGAALVASIHDEFIVEAEEAMVDAAAAVLQREMTRALLEVYPEAAAMRAADLNPVAIADTWAEKP